MRRSIQSYQKSRRIWNESNLNTKMSFLVFSFLYSSNQNAHFERNLNFRKNFEIKKFFEKFSELDNVSTWKKAKWHLCCESRFRFVISHWTGSRKGRRAVDPNEESSVARNERSRLRRVVNDRWATRISGGERCVHILQNTFEWKSKRGKHVSTGSREKFSLGRVTV